MVWHVNVDLPLNWALCDGGSYGTPPVTTPDLRGRFMIGFKIRVQVLQNILAKLMELCLQMANGLVCSSLATTATGGEQYHLLTIAEMPTHDHGFSRPQTSNNQYVLDPLTTNTPYWTATTTGVSTTNTGGGGSHNNIPQFYALAYIMRISSVILI